MLLPTFAPRVLFFSKGVKDNIPSPLVLGSARHPKMFFFCFASRPPQGAGNKLLLPPFSSSLIESATLRLHGSWASSRNFYGLTVLVVHYSLCTSFLLTELARRNRSYACCGAFYACSCTHSRVSGNYDHLPSRSLMNSCLLPNRILHRKSPTTFHAFLCIH